METTATKRTDLMLVDPRNLEVEAGFNVRKDYGDIRGLALSIVALGVQEPLIGFKVRGEDKFVVTDGHRREKAIKFALEAHAKGDVHFADISKIANVPVRLASSDPIERLFTMAVTGEKKKNLTDLERADMYSRLIDSIMETKQVKRGDAIDEVIVKVGISKPTLYNIISLNKLPEEIKEAIAKNEISGSTVVTIVREVKDEDEQKRLVFEAIASAKATGSKKKATAAHVKGLASKSPMQRLKEVVERLKEKEATNVRATALIELVAMLEDKKSINKMLDLFL
jgi:ParB family chromosome partitioning protein